jgi:hypothetical protein
MNTSQRTVAWVKPDPFGVEFAEIELGRGRLVAKGSAIGSRPVVYRLDYTLATRAGYVTSRLRVSTRGQGWRRTLELRRGSSGSWSAASEQIGEAPLAPAGGEPTAFAGALDCDLGLSPLTNSLPVLRLGLLGGGAADLLAVWIAVPDLSVHLDGQRYRFLRSERDETLIRFEAADGTFAADVAYDQQGLVVDYPGIASRLR